jgi:hypothetical protein
MAADKDADVAADRDGDVAADRDADVAANVSIQAHLLTGHVFRMGHWFGQNTSDPI